MNYAQEDAIRELVKEQAGKLELWISQPDNGQKLQDELIKLHNLIDGEDEQLWTQCKEMEK